MEFITMSTCIGSRNVSRGIKNVFRSLIFQLHPQNFGLSPPLLSKIFQPPCLRYTQILVSPPPLLKEGGRNYVDIFLLPMHVVIVMNSIKLVTCFFQSDYEPYGTNALVGFQLWTLHFSKA